MLNSNKLQSGILISPSTDDWDSYLTGIQSLDWEGLELFFSLTCTQSAFLSKEVNQISVC